MTQLEEFLARGTVEPENIVGLLKPMWPRLTPSPPLIGQVKAKAKEMELRVARVQADVESGNQYDARSNFNTWMQNRYNSLLNLWGDLASGESVTNIHEALARELTALCKWCYVQIAPQGVVRAVAKTPTVITWEGWEYNFGYLLLEFQKALSAPTLSFLDGPPRVSGYPHPHSIGRGICFGEASGVVETALRSGRLSEVMFQAVQVLGVYNKESPIAPIESWLTDLRRNPAICGCGYSEPDVYPVIGIGEERRGCTCCVRWCHLTGYWDSPYEGGREYLPLVTCHLCGRTVHKMAAKYLKYVREGTTNRRWICLYCATKVLGHKLIAEEQGILNLNPAMVVKMPLTTMEALENAKQKLSWRTMPRASRKTYGLVSPVETFTNITQTAASCRDHWVDFFPRRTVAVAPEVLPEVKNPNHVRPVKCGVAGCERLAMRTKGFLIAEDSKAPRNGKQYRCEDHYQKESE